MCGWKTKEQDGLCKGFSKKPNLPLGEFPNFFSMFGVWSLFFPPVLLEDFDFISAMVLASF